MPRKTVKKPTNPPTRKQKDTAKAVIENRGISSAEAMRKAGYSEATIKNPSQIMESEGVKDALAEYGLTEELIASSLVEDIQEKKKNRLDELRFGAELLKMTGSNGPAVAVQVNIKKVTEKVDNILEDD